MLTAYTNNGESASPKLSKSDQKNQFSEFPPEVQKQLKEIQAKSKPLTPEQQETASELNNPDEQPLTYNLGPASSMKALSAILRDNKFMSQVVGFFDPCAFDEKSYKLMASFATDFYKQHGECPSRDLIADQIKLATAKSSAEERLEWLTVMNTAWEYYFPTKAERDHLINMFRQQTKNQKAKANFQQWLKSQTNDTNPMDLTEIIEKLKAVNESCFGQLDWAFNDWQADCDIAADQKDDWFWEGWGEFGTLGMLTGLPFSGKSQLVAELIAAIAKGESFCDRPLTQCPIILLDYENKEKTLIGRIKKALNGDEGDIAKLYHRVPLLNLPRPLSAEWIKATIAKLKSKIELVNGRCFVIVDTFRSANAGGENDEMSPSEMVNVLAPLQTLAKETGAFILVLHHNAKHSDDFSGTTAIAAMVDYMWNWNRSDDRDESKKSEPARLYWKGRTDYQEPLCFNFNKMTSRNEFIGTGAEVKDNIKQLAEEARLVKIIKYLGLEESEGATRDEIADLCKSEKADTGKPLSRSTIQERIKLAETRGFIKSSGAGTKGNAAVYWLSDSGHSLVNKSETLKLITVGGTDEG
jgi:hypothetical protein